MTKNKVAPFYLGHGVYSKLILLSLSVLSMQFDSQRKKTSLAWTYATNGSLAFAIAVWQKLANCIVSQKTRHQVFVVTSLSVDQF